MIGRKKIGGVKSIKKTDNSKKTELLSKIDQKLSDMGEKYGPVVYEELQSRLEKTIDIFHKDVDSLFSSFSTYKSDNKVDNSNEDKSSKKPKYISDYENSKKD
tara:strand:- start:57 stop:365 length:309 start_codon:yes stop_codon:yes gene_type:complete